MLMFVNPQSNKSINREKISFKMNIDLKLNNIPWKDFQILSKIRF